MPAEELCAGTCARARVVTEGGKEKEGKEGPYGAGGDRETGRETGRGERERKKKIKEREGKKFKGPPLASLHLALDVSTPLISSVL